MKKNVLCALLIGIAFYLGAKTSNQTFKVGKFIIEFQDRTTCTSIETIKIEKTVTKSKTLAEIFIKLPKTEVEKILGSHKNKDKDKEPELKTLDPILAEEKIEQCYIDVDVEHAKGIIGNWTKINKAKECKVKELVFQNCFYEEDKEFKKECEDEQETTAIRWKRARQKELWADTPEDIAKREDKKRRKKEELKDTFKEALEEVKNGNIQ